MGEIKTTDQLTFRNTVLLGLEPSASFINGSAAVRISRMRRQQQDHLRTASKYIRNCVALTWEIVFICLFQYCSDLIIVLLYTTRLQPYSSHLNHLQHCIHIHYLKKILYSASLRTPAMWRISTLLQAILCLQAHAAVTQPEQPLIAFNVMNLTAKAETLSHRVE